MTPEEYYTMHQKAFRCAFDFLNKHFPPSQDCDWWLKTAQDVTVASATQGENRLAVHLLAGVYEYLDDERERRKKNGETDH